MNTQLSHSETQASRFSKKRFTSLRKPEPRLIVGALAVCMALQMTSFVMILPLFARRFTDFGAGVQELSLSSLAYAFTSTLAAPFMGALSDRIGKRTLVLGSLFMSWLFVGTCLLPPLRCSF